MNLRGKNRFFNLRFLYSQDLSNYKTQAFNEYEWLKNKAKASIESEGVRQANSNAFLASLEGMNNMSFNDLELADKKLKLEIEKLQSQIGGDSEQDDKLIDFAKALRGAFDDE